MAQAPKTPKVTGKIADANTDPAAVPPELLYQAMGSSGLRQYSGIVREEFLPVLQGRRGSRTYREMQDNSAPIGAILFAIKQTILSVKWRWEPADTSEKAIQAKEFAESCFVDMRTTWRDFLSEITSMFTFGYSLHEVTWKVRKGIDPQNRLASSKFDDGLIGIADIAGRSQETIYQWDIARDGFIEAVHQQPWSGTGMVCIPSDKFLLFRTDASKNNPEGRSLLRNGYRPWFYMKRLEEIEAVGIERFACGVPVVTIPSSVMTAATAGDAGSKAALLGWENIAKNLRMDEQAGLVIPSDTDERGHPLYDVKLLTTGGSRPIQITDVIGRYSTQIAQSVLADFIMLGHGDSSGTRALGFSKVELFLRALQGYVDSIAATINDRVVDTLWELNNFPEETKPRLKPDMVRRADLSEMSSYVSTLAGAGARMFPDDNLEEFLRDIADLPPLPEGEDVLEPVSTLEPLLEARLNTQMALLAGNEQDPGAAPQAGGDPGSGPPQGGQPPKDGQPPAPQDQQGGGSGNG